MTKLLVLTLLGVFFLVAAVLSRKRKENLTEEAKKINFKPIDKEKVLNSFGSLLEKTFLFAKGNHFDMKSAFYNEGDVHYILDMVHSSSGNDDITYQHLIFIMRYENLKLKSFVIETINPVSRVKSTDLKAASFVELTHCETDTYIKSAQYPSEVVSELTGLKELLDKYEPLSLEYHSGYLLVYYNSTKRVKNGINAFYKDIKELVSPI